MEHNSLQAWFADRAMEHTTVEQLAALMPDYGMKAAEQVVLEDMAERFDDEVITATSGNEYIEAFNRLTSDWPHRPRPVLAAHIIDSDNDYPEEFTNQAHDFAEAEEVLGREMQTTLDVYYNENPFTDRHLSDQEAMTITVARMLGFSDEDVPLDEIEDHDDFVWWLREDEDMEKALRLHHFGRDLPDGVFEYAAEPDEWSIPASDLDDASCINCGTDHVRIQHADEGVAYTTEDGDVAPVEDISESEQYFYRDTYTGQGLVCEQCLPSFENAHTGVIVTDRGATDIITQSSFIEDMGYDDPDLVSLSELSDEQQEMAGDLATFDVDGSDWHVLVPDDTPVTSGVAQERLGNALDEPTELDPLDDSNGPAGIVRQSIFDGDRYMAIARRDDWPACRYTKEMLEGSHGVTA